MTLRSEFLSQLFKRRLVTRRHANGIGSGNRSSMKIGEALEFADFKPYSDGDAVRHVDPSIYARTGQIFVRQFHEERPLDVCIVLDCTASMVAANQEKYEYALSLVEALSALALAGGDCLRICAGGAMSKVFRSKGSYRATSAWLRQQPAPVEMNWQAIAAQVNKASVIVMISDFLFEDPKAVIAAFAKQGAEVWAVQVLSPEEESPEAFASREMIMKDAESGQQVSVSLTPQIVEAYKQLMNEHRSGIAQSVASSGGRLLVAQTNRDIEQFVMQTYFNRAGVAG